MYQENMIHYFKTRTTYLLTWPNHFIETQVYYFFFWLWLFFWFFFLTLLILKNDFILIPSFNTPRLTVCENTETEQFIQAISIVIFSYSQWNVNFRQGQIDEYGKIYSEVESHIEDIIQMENFQHAFQLCIWLWLQPYHSFFIAKEWTDTINNIYKNKIKNKVNPKSFNLCEKQ